MVKKILKGFQMTTSLIILLVIAVVSIIVLWSIGGYNGLVRLKALVDEAWSGIDVQLKRRYDLIPNLVAVVKQYSIHEQTVLENVTKYRSIAMSATTVDNKAHAEAGLTQALKTLFAVTESYPDLKANENFISLQRNLVDLENDIQLSRRYYNGAVRNYLSSLLSFPTNIIGSLFNFDKVSYFELDMPEQRQAPQVKF